MMKNQKNSQQKLPSTAQQGLLISTFGAQAELEDATGNLIHCHIRKNADPVVTGDHVYWIKEQDGTGSILGPLPRKSLLYRGKHAHKQKLIAANIDAIIIVTAPPPVLSETMLDHYLVAAEHVKIPAVILLNKIDLVKNENSAAIHERLAIYQNIGYPVLESSALMEEGLKQLEHYLVNKTCVLVGASGVGKSSIIAALTDTRGVKIGEVAASQLGKHTTTTTRLYHLRHGGNLIDSPGVREFGVGHIDKNNLIQGFIEFKPFLQQCKFRDCRHQKEPGCALKQAVADKKISAQRFESYFKICAESERR